MISRDAELRPFPSRVEGAVWFLLLSLPEQDSIGSSTEHFLLPLTFPPLVMRTLFCVYLPSNNPSKMNFLPNFPLCTHIGLRAQTLPRQNERSPAFPSCYLGKEVIHPIDLAGRGQGYPGSWKGSLGRENPGQPLPPSPSPISRTTESSNATD